MTASVSHLDALFFVLSSSCGSYNYEGIIGIYMARFETSFMREGITSLLVMQAIIMAL